MPRQMTLDQFRSTSIVAKESQFENVVSFDIIGLNIYIYVEIIKLFCIM